MVKRLLILCSILPFFVLGQIGVDRPQLTLRYGVQSINSQSGHSLELIYDHHLRSCTSRAYPIYLGFGITNSINSNFSEWGTIVKANPVRWGLRLTRKSYIMPYLFLQGNYISLNNESVTKAGYTYRPGLGATLYRTYQNGIALRPDIQIGYTVGQHALKPYYGWTIQFRIGVGIDFKRFEQNRKG